MSVDLFERDAEGRFSLTPVGAFLALIMSSRWPRRFGCSPAVRLPNVGRPPRGCPDRALRLRATTRQPTLRMAFGAARDAVLFHQGWHEITTPWRVRRRRCTTSRASRRSQTCAAATASSSRRLRQPPWARGVLFDLPISVRGAPDNFRNLGVADRVSIVEGSAEESVRAMELCTMKSVLHMCTDEQCVRILSRCAAALPRGGKLLVLERVVPDHDGYHWSKLVDVTMLVMTGGPSAPRLSMLALRVRRPRVDPLAALASGSTSSRASRLSYLALTRRIGNSSVSQAETQLRNDYGISP